MATINEYIAYTIIDEANYNDVVKTTIDGVQLLRTDDEEMYMCTDDIAKIIPAASSALCAKETRKYDFGVAKWGWVRVKFTDNGYYCDKRGSRAALTFVNTRLVFDYIRNIEQRTHDERRAAVLNAILDAAVLVFDKNPDWTPFCAVTKQEYDAFTNKYHSKTNYKPKKKAVSKKVKPVTEVSPIVQITDMPAKPTDAAVAKVVTTSRIDTFLKELSRVATTEGVEITISIKPVSK